MRAANNPPMRNARVALVNMGCAKNLVDSEWMLGSVRQAGYQTTSNLAGAEVVIVNTCAFIAEATEESKQVLRELARARRRGVHRVLICAGCLSQRFREQVLHEFPEVDALVGVDCYREMGAIVRRALAGEQVVRLRAPTVVPHTVLPRMVSTPPWTAYLKISEGCDHACSFCAIPSIRGRYRSTPIPVLVREAQALAARGAKELNLVSQDSTQYGHDLPARGRGAHRPKPARAGKPDLTDLLVALEEVEGIRWLRVLYAYPTRVRRRLLEWMGRSERLCHYLDLPIQHVSARLLKAMCRSGSADSYRRMIETARSLVPDVTLRTTVIAGFPGETDADFEELCRFLEEVKFDRLGAFAFRAEEGTAAAGKRNQVPDEVKEERRRRIMELQARVSLERGRAQVRKVLPVLVESVDARRGVAVGRSPRDAPEVDGVTVVRCGSRPLPNAGQFVHARITRADEHDLHGVLVRR